MELAELPIGIYTVGALTDLPDRLLILAAFSDAQQTVRQAGSLTEEVAVSTGTQPNKDKVKLLGYPLTWISKKYVIQIFC